MIERKLMCAARRREIKNCGKPYSFQSSGTPGKPRITRTNDYTEDALLMRRGKELGGGGASGLKCSREANRRRLKLANKSGRENKKRK